MYTYEAVNLKGQAGAVIIALLASLIVLTNPFVTVSKADYIDSNSGPIVYNDRVCNLGDPNDHSTSATAFEISTSEQLWEITDCVSNSATIYFELGDDIDVSQATTAPTNSPIGFSTSAVAYSFSGVFDGNNKLISGISMSATSYGVGLFAYLHNATVSNLVISGSFATTGNEASHSAGSLAIRANGFLDVSSVSNQADVKGLRRVGGLLGLIAGNVSISHSRNFGLISGSFPVGGLSGQVFGAADVNDSHNFNSVHASSRYAAGLIGYLNGDVRVIDSSNEGHISTDGEYSGGLFGRVIGEASVSSSLNFGKVSVTGGRYAGGLVGRIGDGGFSASHNSADVAASGGSAGGLAGEVERDVGISFSHNSGTVFGTDEIGGLVGRVASGDANIHSSQNTGRVSGSNRVGGLLGYVNDATIAFSSNSGTVSGTADDVGGLVGYIQGANIELSSNLGTVSGQDHVGGLVGYVLAAKQSLILGVLVTLLGGRDAKIVSSLNAGNVSAANHVGGLLGYVLYDANIENSFNTGNIFASSEVGGLVGRARNASVTSAYNTGDVAGATDVDGIAGLVARTVTTTSAYSSVASDFVATSTTAEMQLASTYVGFDLNTIWGFGTCTQNGGFPMLRVLAQVPTYYSAGCFTETQNSNPAPAQETAPAPVYSGPIIDHSKSVLVGSEVSFTGRNLGSVTAAYIGPVEVSISSVTSQSLVLSVASSSDLGVFDLVLQSSFGTLTFQNGITVLEPEPQIVAEATPGVEEIQKLTVGSFSGFIAIYTKGYEGRRLSAKVAGKWLVVESLDESFKGNDHSRTVRRTGSGYNIKVHLYIDREFLRTEELSTK